MKTVLVTGATDGIGLATAHMLAERGARVVVHGRTRDKAETAARRLCEATGKEVFAAVSADLGDLDAVHAMADEVLRRCGALDALVNNAGVYLHERAVTRQGWELTLAVNHLAPFALAHLLLPALERARGRIVNVSSVAHVRGQVDWTDLDLAKPGAFDGYRAYATSKLMMVLCTYELARRLAAAGRGVTVNAVHPGVISTKLLRGGFGAEGDDVERGAAAEVKLAIGDEVAGVSGKYFDMEEERRSSRAAYDEGAQREAYRISVERTGVTPVGGPA